MVRKDFPTTDWDFRGLREGILGATDFTSGGGSRRAVNASDCYQRESGRGGILQDISS
ncbi:hypothetical protein [Streptomyces sp. A5-4]|uniref:hypothetical protein n=1 Tax=Streptomyces sp. A5-4 TaxID=3384771 RepID=UPI003DA84F46